MTNSDTGNVAIEIRLIREDFEINDLDGVAWDDAKPVSIDRYWSGEIAPVERHFETRLLWSETSLYIRFDAAQYEVLIVNKNPDLTQKTPGLWDRDVCEIFIEPDIHTPGKYYEFEVAPTAEWLDLGIHQKPFERKTDSEYSSGMKTAARVDDDVVIMAIEIPWSAFDKAPIPGDIWKGNLYRAVGKGKTRGYLAWMPTETAEADFHVPEKFGEFIFVK